MTVTISKLESKNGSVISFDGIDDYLAIIETLFPGISEKGVRPDHLILCTLNNPEVAFRNGYTVLTDQIVRTSLKHDPSYQDLLDAVEWPPEPGSWRVAVYDVGNNTMAVQRTLRKYNPPSADLMGEFSKIPPALRDKVMEGFLLRPDLSTHIHYSLDVDGRISEWEEDPAFIATQLDTDVIVKKVSVIHNGLHTVFQLSSNENRIE